MKTLIIDNWHFWESNGKILASNEALKKLYSFDNFYNSGRAVESAYRVTE